MQPSQRPRFVSGKFVWDYDGHKLVKDAGKHAIATFHLEREKSATQPQIKLLSLLLGKYRSSLGTDNLHGLALFRLLILMNNDKQAHTHTHMPPIAAHSVSPFRTKAASSSALRRSGSWPSARWPTSRPPHRAWRGRMGGFLGPEPTMKATPRSTAGRSRRVPVWVVELRTARGPKGKVPVNVVRWWDLPRVGAAAAVR